MMVGVNHYDKWSSVARVVKDNHHQSAPQSKTMLCEDRFVS
jgi:hypothetical protein